jgi:transposase
LLAIDVCSAACFFQASPTANASVIAQYMADLATDLQAKGYKRVSLYLDRNSTHLNKMRTEYSELTQSLTIQMRFIHFAPYSPALNPVEYAIHWIRQHSLHQADCGQNLSDVKQRLLALLHRQVVLSKEQLVNILVHIEGLVETKQKANLSP